MVANSISRLSRAGGSKVISSFAGPPRASSPCASASRNNVSTCLRDTENIVASALMDKRHWRGRGKRTVGRAGQRQAEQNHDTGVALGEHFERGRVVEDAKAGDEFLDQRYDKGAHEDPVAERCHSSVRLSA